MEKGLFLKKIILSLISFIIFWAMITNAWGYSDYIFKNDFYEIGRYIYGYISRLIWVIPAILLIMTHNNRLKIDKKELFSRLKLNRSLILVIIVSVSYVMTGMLINHKEFWFHSELNLVFVIIQYMMVGFVEETVFRGWGYNALANILSYKKAAVISTGLFVLLHWPAYFIKFLRFGIFDVTGIIAQSFSALICGVIFCLLLEKGKTIWNPIAVHIIYDLMCVLFIGEN